MFTHRNDLYKNSSVRRKPLSLDTTVYSFPFRPNAGGLSEIRAAFFLFSGNHDSEPESHTTFINSFPTGQT